MDSKLIKLSQLQEYDKQRQAHLPTELNELDNAVVCTLNITKDNTSVELLNEGYTEVDWGDGTTSNEDFAKHIYLKSGEYVCVIKGLTKIPGMFFNGAGGFGRYLTSVKLPKSITALESQCFAGSNITHIDIPDSVIDIVHAVFSSLESATIGSGVKTIGLFAFDCDNLKQIEIKAKTPPTLADLTSIIPSVEKIIVPIESVQAYKEATNWSYYADKIVGTVDTNYLDENLENLTQEFDEKLDQKLSNNGDQVLNGNLTLTGNLNIKGTNTAINTETVTVNDNIIVTNAQGAATPYTGVVSVTGNETYKLIPGTYTSKTFSAQEIIDRHFGFHTINFNFIFDDTFIGNRLEFFTYEDSPLNYCVAGYTYVKPIMDTEGDYEQRELFGPLFTGSSASIGADIEITEDNQLVSKEDFDLLQMFFNIEAVKLEEAYASAVFNTEENSIQLGKGYITRGENKVEFTFGSNENQAVATRDDTFDTENGLPAIPYWDADKKCFTTNPNGEGMYAAAEGKILTGLNEIYTHYVDFYNGSVIYSEEAEKGKNVLVLANQSSKIKLYKANSDTNEPARLTVDDKQLATIEDVENAKPNLNLHNGEYEVTDENGETHLLGKYSTVGDYGLAQGMCAIAAGGSAKAYGRYSVALGNGCRAGYTEEEFNVKFPYGMKTSDGTPAEEDYTGDVMKWYDYRAWSVALQHSIARGRFAFAAGTSNQSNGVASFTMGDNNTVDANSAIALGSSNTISAGSTGSIALGRINKTSKEDTVALGLDNTVSGSNGVAIGKANKALSYGAVAIGRGNIIEANAGGFAGGSGNKIYGDDATAFGAENTMGQKSSYSISAGLRNTNNSLHSAVFGEGNKLDNASGHCSFVAGNNNTSATGNRIALIGTGLKSNTSGQIVVGEYNLEDNNAKFIVGNGTVNTSKNAMAVMNDGRTKVYGAPTEDTDVVRLKELKPLQKLIESLTDEQITALNKFAKSLVVTEE